jgi:V/A-type H+-transporting ATPase subunit I
LGAVQLLADCLSYMRLFALGLATMYMCQTFNMLAEMPYKGIPYVGFIPAVLILVAGHAINLLLGVMGGVVHGLRLNFLEWYRWCFEGDGLAFKPFRKIARRV